MKEISKDHSPFFQAGILMAMMFVGLFIGQLISVLIIVATSTDPADNMVVDFLAQPVWTLQATQFITAVTTFLLPALVTAWLCNANPKTYLSIQAFPDIRLLAVVCIATLLLSPTVSLTGYFNSQMHLPQSMAAIEAWMQSTEELADALVRKMVSGQGVVTFIINLFVIAVVAGVTEEFLFRGALLNILRQKIRNHHVAIWIVAIIFSTIHLQFYGFIPRMLLGAYLGYLMFWTKNIWIPVCAHFIYNAFAFIGMSSDSLKDNAIFADEIAPEDIRWLSIVTCLTLIVFFFCLKFVRRPTISEMNSE